MSSELRCSPRWRYLALVLYSSPTVRGEGQLANLSREGAFVRADALPLVGERVHVRLRDAPGTAEFEGEVCWTGPRTEDGEFGFGVRLSSCSEAYAEIVRGVVARPPEQAEPPSSRPAPRVTVAIPVALESGTLCDEGQLRNLSLSGARVENTKISLSVGASVTLTFSMSPKGRVFEVPSCVVRRTENGGYAMRFDVLDPALRAAIEGLAVGDGEDAADTPSALDTQTERERTAAAQSWQVLSRLAESAQHPVVSVDERQRILLINSAAERLFGVGRSEVLGRGLSELMDSGGQVLPFDASIACGESRGEQVFTLVMRDVAQRLQSEQALRDSETRFRVMAETVPDMLFTARSDGWVDYVNTRFHEYSGFEPQSAEGYGWVANVHPEDVDRTLATWRRALASGGLYECKCRLRSRDGEYRWFASRARPIRDERGGIVKWFGVCTDVHELVLAQESLREADRRKNEFFAMLSHELRNPLTPIRNGIELLRMLTPSDFELETTRDLIDRQVTQLVRLVDDLLEVSRLANGKLELRKQRVDLLALVQQAADSVRPALEETGHRLEPDLLGGPLWIEADAPRIQQSITNLLLNAVKFTPSPGTIHVSAQRAGGKVLLRVRDTGVGLAPDALERIFELFAREDGSSERPQGGLGIGLTLVRSLIEMHGGRIRARSDGPGRGSEFEIELPLLEGPGLSAPERASEFEPRSRIRILLVEDNVDAAHSWKRLLQLLGHDVAVAYEGASALELMESGGFELAFIDIGLPGMSGYELAQHIRELGAKPAPALIALTGYALEEDRQRALDAGFDAHLVKPVRLEDLRAVLAKVCSATAPSTERVLH